MPFNLFHKKKQPEQQTLASNAQEQTEPQTAPAEQPLEAPVEAVPAVAPEAQPEPEAPAPVEEAKQEPAPEAAPAAEEQPQEAPKQEESQQPEEPPVAAAPAPAPEQPKPQEQPVEQKPAEPASKTYLKAMPLKDLSDVENVKNEVRNGNIIILRITPLAGKSIEDVKTAVNDLFAFAEEIQGDIARLGEERVVICPKTIRIWREKTPAPVRDNQPLPTAA